ncbi:hypothetical protein [uncultured Mucilaginibacter sp.]|uniref:hypothetical protein n=1 Tax=uncultured Mucilaginibacter sp. TaxID=797541 RepID=UPI0025EB7DC3|nr:hypothetical protein [uncultured Mucilaginibacter sp.]
MNNASSNRPSIGQWVSLITCGWLIGFITGIFMADALETLHLDFALIIVGMSFWVGLMQRIALRKQLFINNLWVLFEVLGLSTPFVISNFIVVLLNNSFPGLIGERTNMLLIIVATPIGGTFAGWLQYKFMLINDDSKNSREWIKYSFIGWTGCSFFIMTYFLFATSLHLEKSMAGKLLNISVLLLGGPILGGLSGLGLKSISNTAAFTHQ